MKKLIQTKSNRWEMENGSYIWKDDFDAYHVHVTESEVENRQFRIGVAKDFAKAVEMIAKWNNIPFNHLYGVYNILIVKK